MKLVGHQSVDLIWYQTNSSLKNNLSPYLRIMFYGLMLPTERFAVAMHPGRDEKWALGQTQLKSFARSTERLISPDKWVPS